VDSNFPTSQHYAFGQRGQKKRWSQKNWTNQAEMVLTNSDNYSKMNKTDKRLQGVRNATPGHGKGNVKERPEKVLIGCYCCPQRGTPKQGKESEGPPNEGGKRPGLRKVKHYKHPKKHLTYANPRGLFQVNKSKRGKDINGSENWDRDKRNCAQKHKKIKAETPENEIRPWSRGEGGAKRGKGFGKE